MKFGKFVKFVGGDNICKYCMNHDMCDGSAKSDGNGNPYFPMCTELNDDEEVAGIFIEGWEEDV